MATFQKNESYNPAKAKKYILDKASKFQSNMKSNSKWYEQYVEDDNLTYQEQLKTMRGTRNPPL